MKKGYFGDFGGQFVPELLMPPLLELEDAVENILPTKEFQDELGHVLREFVGRPTPLTLCENLSRELGITLWLKREDMAHGGAHKVNNTIGQALLCKKLGKTRLLAETARASTAWPARWPPRAWACPAPSTWAQRTWSARASTCAA